MMFTSVGPKGSKPRWVRNHLVSFVCLVVAVPLMLAASAWGSPGAESSPPPLVTIGLEETNTQEPLRVYLLLQEQLQATQLAVEQNRQETKEAAAQTMEALSNGLQTIQQAVFAQRAQDLEAMRKSNRIMLVVVGLFAAMGFLTLLMMTCFQWRMSRCLADISAALATALELGPGSAVAGLAPVEHSRLHLPGAVEQPEERRREPAPNSNSALRRRERANLPVESRRFPEPGHSARRRQLRALGMALLVGLLCAAGLALLFYLVTCRKLGFGPLPGG
jgi:hypothetical protein